MGEADRWEVLFAWGDKWFDRGVHEERQDTDKRHLGKSRWRICITRWELSRVLKVSCRGRFGCLDYSVGKSIYCTKLRIRVQIPTIHIKPGHAVYSSVIPALVNPEKGRPVKFCCFHCYCCFCLISTMQILYAKGIRRTVAQDISHRFLSSIWTYMSEHMCAWTTHVSKHTQLFIWLAGKHS